MLILSRRIGETIVINDTILVTVVAIHGSQVRIGVAAPKDMVVDREEIAKRRRAEAAAGITVRRPAPP